MRAMRWLLPLAAIAAIAIGLLLIPPRARAEDKDALAAAAAFPDGGGYDSTWKGTGSPEDVVFQGTTILAKGKNGTYCSGFTFAVAMRVAERRKLLAKCTVAQIRQFQREWFGATKSSKEKQCVVAAESLGIGAERPLKDAQPGDFVQLWRANGTGHSVVGLRWISKDGRLIALEYRSSQGSTGGGGDRIEYFTDVPGMNGTIRRDRTYVCRLHPK